MASRGVVIPVVTGNCIILQKIKKNTCPNYTIGATRKYRNPDYYAARARESMAYGAKTHALLDTLYY